MAIFDDSKIDSQNYFLTTGYYLHFQRHNCISNRNYFCLIMSIVVIFVVNMFVNSKTFMQGIKVHYIRNWP